MDITAGRRVCLLVAGLLVLQVAWIITVPPFRGSDEVDHSYRAAAVAGGEWVAGPYADDGRGWLVTVPENLVEAASAQCAELPYTGPDNCTAVAPAAHGTVLVASSAAGYHPAYYWLVGTAGAPFAGAASLYAMRVASALLCLLFLGLGVWASFRQDTRWPAAGLVLAASPVLVYSTTVVAPNGLEMAAAICLWSSLLSLPYADGVRDQRVLLWSATAAAVVMSTLRLLGPLFVLMSLATVLLVHGRDILEVLWRRRTSFLAGTVLVGLSVTGFAWWTFGGHQLAPATDGPDGSGDFVPRNLVLWALQSIAAFPYRDQSGPGVVYVVVAALVLAILGLAVRRGRPRERWALVVALVGVLTLPVILTVITMDGRGVIWQGRYGLPYGVGFVLLAGHVVGRRKSSPRLSWPVVVPATVALAAGVAASLVKVRDRELAVNAASRLDESWRVPPPLLLVALSVLAMACLACAVGGGSREPS